MTLMEKIHKRLRPYAKDRGLLRKGRTYYTITEDTAYCVGFEDHGHEVCVQYYLMPLYMRSEYHCLTYGERLNVLFRERIPLLQKSATEEEIDAWVAIVTGIIDSFVLPFFRQVDSPEKLLEFLNRDWEEQKKYLFCPPERRLRLKIYILLYLHRQADARTSVAAYREELGRCTYLTDRILQNLYREAGNLEVLCSETHERLDAFFVESMACTKEKCFS